MIKSISRSVERTKEIRCKHIHCFAPDLSFQSDRFVRQHLPKCDERISQFAADNVDTSLRDAETSEKLAYVQCVGGPRQILQPDYDAHFR